MKNYLVKSVFKIKSTNWHFRDRAEEGDIFDLYCQANQHSLNTYRKYLQGDWEYLYLTGECETINDQFIYKFWRLHDLWHSEPCNIFYADADTIAIKPFNPWNYDKFMMFIVVPLDEKEAPISQPLYGRDDENVVSRKTNRV